MTGLRTWRRGVSLRNESTIACTRIVGSNSARAFTVPAMASAPSSLRRDEVEMLDDRTQGKRRDERQRAHQDDHADQQPDEQGRVGRQGAGAGLDDRLP